MHIAASESMVAAQQAEMSEAVAVLPAAPGLLPDLSGEAARTEDPPYTYIRQDGSIERAANREEAITLCPVLGKLAVENPAAADLLLDMASIGQAKIAKKNERPEPKTPMQKERALKPEEPDKSAGRSKLQPAEKDDVLPVKNMAAAVTEPTQAQRQPLRPVLPESEKSMPVHTRLEQNLLWEQSISLRSRAALGRLIHERQIQETIQAAVSEEAVAPAVKVQPGAGDERDKSILADVRNNSAGYKSTVLGEGQLIVEQMTGELTPERGETAPVMYEVNFGDGYTGYVESAVNPVNGASLAETAIATRQTEYVHWVGESGDSPEEIYEDFSGALRLMVDSSGTRSGMELGNEGVVGAEDASVEASEALGARAMSAIATLSERLSLVTGGEKEAAAIVVANIVETIQIAETLSAEQADPEAIETAWAGLEEGAIELFERFAIEYEAADVEEFVKVVSGLDFQPPQTEAAEVAVADLEHEGTHEAKRHFPQPFGFVADSKNRSLDFLGKLILFYAIGGRPAIQLVSR